MPPQNTVPDDTQRDIRGISINIFPSLLKYYYKATGKRSSGVSTQPGIKALIQEKVNTVDEFNVGFGIIKGQPDTYDRFKGYVLNDSIEFLDNELNKKVLNLLNYQKLQYSILNHNRKQNQNYLND